jgi:hypothetical protein
VLCLFRVGEKDSITCTNDVEQLGGLLCRVICQQTKEIKGITMRCGSEDSKSTGYFGSKFCGQTKCLSKKEGKVLSFSRGQRGG